MMLSSYPGGYNKSALHKTCNTVHFPQHLPHTKQNKIKKQAFLDRKGCTYDHHEHYWAQVDDEEEEENHC